MDQLWRIGPIEVSPQTGVALEAYQGDDGPVLCIRKLYKGDYGGWNPADGHDAWWGTNPEAWIEAIEALLQEAEDRADTTSMPTPPDPDE